MTVIPRTGPTRFYTKTAQQLDDNSDIVASPGHPGPTYHVPAPQSVSQGISVDALLILVGAGDPSGVTHASVSVRNGVSADLDGSNNNDFADPSSAGFPFEDGPPVFFTNGDDSSLKFIVPTRKTGPQAPNQYLQTEDDGSMTLTVYLAGSLLMPTLTADRQSALVGQPVRFTADAHDTDPHETVTYTFTYFVGANSPPGGAVVSHAFGAAAHYFVSVSVTGTNQFGNAVSTGSSAVAVEVNVTSPHNKRPTQSGTPPKPSSGPSNGNGGRHNPIGGPVNGTGTHGGGAPTGAGSPVLGGSSGPPQPSGQASGSSGVTGRSGSGAASSTAPAKAGGVGGGDRVAGYVLAGVAGAPTGGPPGASNPPLAPSARGSIQAGRVALGGLGLLGVVCLLALGVGAELRRPLRAPRRRAR